jgi:enamine deaminase RidA (YjgF/YER057c/UK114 family)
MISRHNPATAPAVRHYSQVVRVDLGEAALLFISGLVSVDADGQLVGRGDLGVRPIRCMPTRRPSLLRRVLA